MIMMTFCNTYMGVFNKIFDIGYFPDSWGDDFIVPLHKKGSTENVENYRGITLLSIVSKLFSNILNTRLNDWAEKYHVYVEAQAGLRKGMGTIQCWTLPVLGQWPKQLIWATKFFISVAQTHL